MRFVLRHDQRGLSAVDWPQSATSPPASGVTSSHQSAIGSRGLTVMTGNADHRTQEVLIACGGRLWIISRQSSQTPRGLGVVCPAANERPAGKELPSTLRSRTGVAGIESVAGAAANAW